VTAHSMAAASRGNAPAIFDLKSASLPLVAVVLKTADLDALAAELAARLDDTPDFFDQDPVVIDLSPLSQDDAAIDFAALVALLRRYRMVPIAAKGGSAAQMEAARAAGLTEAPAAAPATPVVMEPPAPPVLSEVIREVPVPVPAAPVSALIVDRPLRSGQQVYARGCDLVVMAAVNFGAEVIADGNIHVYAPLRGRAIAGARGNTEARIFTLCLEPELISIAGTYRTTETALPPEVQGKPAQVRLVGEKLVMEPLKP
jgi:septum site-determining protein MinC